MQAIKRVLATNFPSNRQTQPVDPEASYTIAKLAASQGPNTLAESDISPRSSHRTQDNSPFPTLPHLTSTVLSAMVSLSSGDARTALSLLELAISCPVTISEALLLSFLRQSVSISYDRSGESHYDMISALHKSVRGSHGSAALYWLARMLNAGEDPLYIARRMVVCASEDIGLADNHALPLVCPIMFQSW